jgi:capsular polysaccharide biosynthesis protein
LELKWYLQVLLRRWPALLILPLLAVAFAVYQDSNRSEQFSASARLAVVRAPETPSSPDFRYDEYYNYLSSEFKIDDLVETVRGNVFAAAVAQRLGASTGEVQGSLSAERQHRILSVNVTTGDPERTMQIVRAVVEELEQNPELYVDVLTEGAGASVRAIQVPEGAAPDSARARMLLVLGVMVAAGAGVLLAFLVEYLDDTLYDDETTAHALDMPVIGVVPSERAS